MSKFFLYFFVLTLFLPVYNLRASTIEIKEYACKEAKIDAIKDVNHSLWKVSGAFFLIFGAIASNIFVPKPPSSRLIGKSPEFIKYYIKCYKEKRASVQNKDALVGCTYGLTVLTGIFEIYMAYILYKEITFYY